MLGHQGTAGIVTDQPAQQPVGPAQPTRIFEESLVSHLDILPDAGGRRFWHVAHHVVQVGLQIQLCSTSPESHLKGP